MLFQEKKIRLKDGREAVLKTPPTEDAQKMLSYIQTACGETDFLLRYPEEFATMTVEQEATWIQNARDSQAILMITCYVNDKVAGNCEIGFNRMIKTRHRATVHIALLREYWNLGIGSAMFEEMIAACNARGIEIMELEFLEGNDRARHLYEKFGFRVVSEKPNAFKRKDGRMQKEYYMQKYLQ